MIHIKKLSLIFIFLTFSFQAMAQNTIDDGFDPFADYSEFVEASTEETDINFFKYGRLLSFGFNLGQRSFTGPQQEIYQDSLEFGVFTTFYLSIHFAFQVGFQTSQHDVYWEIPSENLEFEGRTQLNNLFLQGKYFFNTQSLTKTIAKFNPYIIGGISQFYRETESPNQLLFSSKDAALGFDAGFGLEYLFNSNKSFIGLQATYHYVSFPNENNAITVENQNGDQVDSGLQAKGDIWQIGLTGGFNF